MTTPATNGNGHVYSDEDITMNTATEAATDTNMEIDRHSIPSPIWARLYDRHPNVMNEVWKRICTAQSTVPGVHIFSLEVPRPRYENAFTPRWMPLGPPKLGPRDGGYGWYFRNANIAPTSFDAHNPSTYLIDSGLWTACKQSRDIMLEEYGLENWRRILSVVWDWKMPLGRHLWRLCYLPNIALELNPAWGHDLSPTDHEANSKKFVVAYIAGLASLLTSNSTLWFVDERFKRKAIAPTREQVAMELKRRVFYGSDRQYVQVMGNGFPLDHDMWELLPQKILGMTVPPICDPFGPGGYTWTWTEDYLDSEGDGLHWSGEWFIHTLQYYIKANVKAQREVDWISEQTKAKIAKIQGKFTNGDANGGNPTNGNHGENINGHGEHHGHKNGENGITNGEHHDDRNGDNGNTNGEHHGNKNGENGYSNGERHDDRNGDWKSDNGRLNGKKVKERSYAAHENRFDGSEIHRFGLLAVEFF
ncbi:hypothetical protein J3F84DRAFT_406871 [Trichoderma pleuroticola]